jgi:hypothetical protein
MGLVPSSGSHGKTGLSALLLVSALTFGSLLATPAYASDDQPDDNGNGLLSCGPGEICFKRDSGGPNSFLRHYWNSDNDHNDNDDSKVFTDGGGPVMDNISSFLNRDTECDVNMYDVDGFGSWFVYRTVSHDVNDTAYDFIGSSDNDLNNGHERCDGTHG